MKAQSKEYTVERLLESWRGPLRVNTEYQRGAVWNDVQKQMLIDSIFRGYPLPAFYLHRKVTHDLDGGDIAVHEVIDGQQRLRALDEFKGNKWRLLDPRQDSRKMRLPAKVKAARCDWAGRAFNDLEPTLQQQFLNTILHVQEISEADDEEVRDLFIRLQSGTTLTRQQIRDAWPGNMGPFIDSIAGRAGLNPKIPVFQFIDNRGTRDDDQDGSDPYVTHRQSCAQALVLFLHRIDNPSGLEVTGTGAKDLDSLYHERTDFDNHCETARRFERVLDLARRILTTANEVRPDSGTVFGKLAVFSLIMILEELTRDPANLVDKDIRSIAEAFNNARGKTQKMGAGRTTSVSVIQDYYHDFYYNMTSCLKMDRLDPVRLFTSEQKDAIRARDHGACSICGQPVSKREEEYDHIKPWLVGGRTEVDNGRLVHAKCHARGKRAVSGN